MLRDIFGIPFYFPDFIISIKDCKIDVPVLWQNLQNTTLFSINKVKILDILYNNEKKTKKLKKCVDNLNGLGYNKFIQKKFT